jgi:hypothetical protein
MITFSVIPMRKNQLETVVYFMFDKIENKTTSTTNTNAVYVC